MNITSPESLLRVFCLSLACWREARGESLLGQLLVAQTIENRVRDPRWPETYVGVITQRLQFSAFNRDDPNVTAYPREDDPAWADCVAAARFVLAAPSPLTAANHYHVTSVSPAWADRDKIVAREHRHIFYRL